MLTTAFEEYCVEVFLDAGVGRPNFGIHRSADDGEATMLVPAHRAAIRDAYSEREGLKSAWTVYGIAGETS